MKHLMIDLETIDTRVTAGIISLGAVFFNIETGKSGPVFHREIGLKNALKDGTNSESTLNWWKEQSPEVQKQLEPSNPVPLLDALNDFSRWVDMYDPEGEVQPWSNGASFDISILNYHYENRFHLTTPWKFYNVRDVRTICKLGDVTKNDFEFEGNAHDPIYDCLHQIKMVHQAHWNLI